MNSLSEGGQEDMMEGLDCNCPDNCNDVIYSQVAIDRLIHPISMEEG